MFDIRFRKGRLRACGRFPGSSRNGRLRLGVFGPGLVLILHAYVLSDFALPQQLSMPAPLFNGSSGFYEHHGIRWGVHHVGPHSELFFQFGAGMQAVPPIRADGLHASRLGVGGRSGNWNWNFGLTAAQASGRSRHTIAPHLTLSPGQFGVLRATTQRPFIRSFVPVVNDLVDASGQSLRRDYQQAVADHVMERQASMERQEARLHLLRQQSEARVRKKRSERNCRENAEPALRLGRPRASTE